MNMKANEIKIHKRGAQRINKRKKLLNSSTPMTIGQQMAFIRKARGLSTGNVEEMHDISRYVIRSIESDKGSTSINSLLSYAASLGCVVIVSPMPSMGVSKTETFNLKAQVNPFKSNTIDHEDAD
jgi:transcriptional regulator with XRE-family HTH domain